MYYTPFLTLSYLPLTALLRQSNSAWEAYFIVTDDQPFDAELRATLSAYGDARLHFLDLDMKYRPKVNRLFLTFIVDLCTVYNLVFYIYYAI